MTRSLEAPPAVFQKAKNDDLANAEVNAVWKNTTQRQHLDAMVPIEAQGQAAIAHPGNNMASQNAAAQRRLSKTCSEISDITHSGCMARVNRKDRQTLHNPGSNLASQNAAVQRRISKHQRNTQYQAFRLYGASDNPLFDQHVNKDLRGRWDSKWSMIKVAAGF